jgi:hypothetical protein
MHCTLHGLLFTKEVEQKITGGHKILCYIVEVQNLLKTTGRLNCYNWFRYCLM